MRSQIDPYLKPLASLARSEPARTGDHDLGGPPPAPRAVRPAAVLVPLVEHADGPTVLLTERTAHLNHHAGQVSFPGGRTDEGDANPVATALREAHEEIGLHAHQVEVAGLLDNYQTGTGFMVTPVVGYIQPGFVPTLDAFEVACAFEVPLRFFIDSRNHAIESRLDGRTERRFYVFRYDGHVIWGATAGMLINLYRRMNGLL